MSEISKLNRKNIKRRLSKSNLMNNQIHVKNLTKKLNNYNFKLINSIKLKKNKMLKK